MSRKKWVVAAKRADFDEIAKKYNITPMLARIIRNRDITEDKDINMFLNGTVDDMYDPHLLIDMEKAVDIILKHADQGNKVRIVGDYDVDGVCASFILKSGFTDIGIDADVRLPERITDGYGINENMIREAVCDGVRLIVTCDNGIAAAKEIEFAKENGIEVVVTDHHEVPYEMINGKRKYLIPAASAVVDPKREECIYPYKEICGALVAFKVIQATFMKKGISSDPKSGRLHEYIQFAAFATVGDVMPLLDENRIVVKYGLSEMGSTENTGLKALIDITNVDRDNLTPYHVGFILGPCVNASGRLDSANRALNLFLARERGEAVIIANELKELNDSRKDMTEFYFAKAVQVADEMTASKVLVIYLPDCHESLAGIVAGRIKERYYRPTFILTKGDDSVKGSGRSIEAYNMYEEMTKVHELFSKFGGHKMAAGLSMDEADIDELRRRLNENAVLNENDLIEKITIDIPMPVNYATMDFIEELDRLAPFGQCNSKPLFAEKNLLIRSIAVVGKNRNVVKLKLGRPDDAVKYDAIAFGDGDAIYEELSGRDSLSIVYYPQVNEFMGNKSVQIVLKEWM